MYYVTGNNTMAEVNESMENVLKEEYLMRELDFTEEEANNFTLTLYDVTEYLENGDLGDYGPCVPAENEEEALDPLGGVKVKLGEFADVKTALEAFIAYERADYELNLMNINGTVSTYYELENGDILEISHADPDGEFLPPVSEKDYEAWKNGIDFRAIIYDRERLEEELEDEYGDITEAIIAEETEYSTSLHDFKELDLTHEHMIKKEYEDSPIVTFSIEDAVALFKGNN